MRCKRVGARSAIAKLTSTMELTGSNISSTVSAEEQVAVFKEKEHRFRTLARPLSTSRGERQSVCCILYLTKYGATGTAHRSGPKLAQ